MTSLGPGFWRVELRYGFMDRPDVPEALALCSAQGLDINPFEVSYFLSREIIVPSRGRAMTRWREALFVAMTRNAGSVADVLPPAGQLRDRARDPGAALTGRPPGQR